MKSTITSVRHTVRLLGRRPAVFSITVATLGIGLGSLIAALLLLDRVVLRQPSLRDPARVVVVWEVDPKEPEGESGVSPADFFDLSESGVFESAGAFMKWNLNLTGIAVPRRVRAALVSGGFFDSVGTEAIVGRTLRPSDATRGNDDVVVLSERLWRELYRGDRAIIGRRIGIDSGAATVVGVVPRAFTYPSRDIDIWTPFVFGAQFQADDREGRNLRMVGRLRDDVSLQQAAAAVSSVAKRIETHSPDTHNGWTASIDTLHAHQTRELRPTVLMILAAATAMLVVAVANVVNLLLMLASSRMREFATRLALGAGRARLLRLAAIEGVIPGVLAGAAALAVAWSTLGLMRSLGGEVLTAADLGLTPLSASLGIASAILISVAAATGSMLLFLRADLFSAIRSSRQLSASGSRVRSGLLVAQIALTAALLIPAGMLLKSFQRLSSVDPGFDRQALLTAGVWLPGSYAETPRQIAFFQQAIDRIDDLPGVDDVATIQDLPLKGNAMTFGLTIDAGGRSIDSKAAYRVVSDRYFDVMRIPIRRGRAFDARDDSRSQPVVIVNDALAAHAFPKRDAVGQRIRIDGDGPWATVVGVAGDVKQMGIAGDEVPAVYQPLAQKQFAFLRWNTLVIRTTGAVTPELVSSIRGSIAKIDPNQPTYDVKTIDSILDDQLSKPRLAASVVSYLGVAALSVALMGIGGVLSFAVKLRAHELGIRAALGATPSGLVALVLRQTTLVTCTGIAIGLVIAVIASPLLGRLLFEVEPLDLSVYSLCSLALLLAALAAGALPAMRASRVDPATALRSE